MDIEKALTDIIPENMRQRGQITLDSVLSPIKDVLNRRRFPEVGLSDLQIDKQYVRQVIKEIIITKDEKN